MNEAFAADLQFPSQLPQVRLDDGSVEMDERIEAKHEIDRAVRKHRQGESVVFVALHTRIIGEPPATRFDAIRDAINSPQLLAIIPEIMRPSPVTRSDLQDHMRRETFMNARQDGAKPLRL